MSLAYDMVVSASLLVIAVVFNRISLYIFAPSTPLHELAAQAEALNGAARAMFWYEILALWVPLFVIVVAFAWPIVRAWRRQTVTARTPRP